jgi:integrase
MRAPAFPQEITKDSCTVTIYEREYPKTNKDGKTRHYLEYRLAWYEDGKRTIETSSDYLALRTRADEVLDDLKEGRRTGPGALKAYERNDYTRAIEILKPTGQRLDTAVANYAEAFKILGGDLVVVAAQEYVRRNLTKIKPRLVSEVVDELIADKERQKRSDAHVKRLDSHLRKFAESMVKNIATVTAAEMDLFLDNLSSDKKAVGPRTRDNYADSIVTLYKWAKRKRFVPADFDETDRITRLDKDEDGSIEIYTPEEIKALLSTAEDSLIPFLAIGAFAGLRSSEIMRLDWADVRLENGDPHVVVQQGKVKKRGKSRRIVPMTENLRAWLKPRTKKSGSVWPHSTPYLYEMLRELAPKAEVALREAHPKAKLEWKANALRHSFISYRVASIKNVAQVALEAGNSPQMIFSNYREIVTEPDAVKWFGISPAA